MSIIYTSGKVREPIYLTDEQCELLKGKRLYISGKYIICYVNRRSVTITSILYPDMCSVKRINTELYDYRPSNIDRSKNVVGTSVFNIRGFKYHTANIYTDGKQIKVPGYYKTKEDAIIAREVYIIKNNLDHKLRNKTKLSDKEILEEYDRIVKKKKQEQSEACSYSLHTTAIEKHENYGLSCEKRGGKVYYSARVNDKIVCVHKDIIATKCIRNLYIVDNNIKGDKVYDVGMTLDEQRHYVADYVRSHRIGVKSKREYRGLSIIRRLHSIRYAVQLYNEGKRVYVGASENKILAAMMYNVYQFKVGKVKESINDVGMSIDEQIRTLAQNGYYMTEDFRFKDMRRA